MSCLRNYVVNDYNLDYFMISHRPFVYDMRKLFYHSSLRNDETGAPLLNIGLREKCVYLFTKAYNQYILLCNSTPSQNWLISQDK